MKYLTAPDSQSTLPLPRFGRPSTAIDWSNVKNAYWKGQRFASEGAYWSMPVVALQAAVAKPGEIIPTIAAQSISLAVQPIASGVASAALAFTVGLSPAAAAVAATILAGVAASHFEHKLTRSLTELSKEGQRSTTLRFGGNYVDTITAQQRRNRAAIELTGALPTSRRWLGQEALYLHN